MLAFLLTYSLLQCQASPIPRAVNTLEDERGLLGEASCALHFLYSSTARSCTTNYNFPLGHKILCYMYDKYVVEYSNQDPQNGAQISLNVTCKWVQFKESQSSGCSLPEIREMCATYRLHQLCDHEREILADFNSHVKARQESIGVISPPADSELKQALSEHSNVPIATQIACDLF